MKRILPPQNYLSFVRGKSFLKRMLFYSFFEAGIGFGGTNFGKMILGNMSEWEETKKNFRDEIYHG